MKKNLGVAPLVFPQPVLIIATYDENKKANAMNAAWGGIVGKDKIIINLSAHKTTDNIMKRKAFTISIGDKEHMLSCDYVGIVSANNEPDKMEKAGFTTTKSKYVDAPVINELPMALECELLNIIEGDMYLARIVNVLADESILSNEGKIMCPAKRRIRPDPPRPSQDRSRFPVRSVRTGNLAEIGKFTKKGELK